MDESKDNKKYWLKLDKDFLKSPQMKVIKSMTNGKDYIIFYLSLMLESVETVGHLRFTSLVPYNAEMLSAITETNIDIVRSAIKIFCELGLMQIFDDGTIFLPEVPKITGKESESAERVRKFRAKQKQEMLQCNTNVTNCNGNIDIDIDKDIDIKKDINKNIYIVEQIVDYLNEKCKTNYKSTTKKTKSLIKARLDEGFSLEDFKKVIDIKSKQWLNTKMEEYLRPETLFGTKFESYLNKKQIKSDDELIDELFDKIEME